MQTSSKRWVIWLAILFLAAILRLPGVDWDMGFALHPDERYLVDLSRNITLFADPCSVDPLYPYGHFPLYLISPWISTANAIDPLYAARLLSGIVGVLLVAITGAAGRFIGRDGVGWMAALIISFAPLLIQSARFYTVDTIGAASVTLALYAAMRNRWRVAGISGAVAVASKISFGWVWVVLISTSFYTHHKMNNYNIKQHNILRNLVLLTVWGILGYVVTSPWMILNPRQCWSGPLAQVQVVTGRIKLPYTLQYNGTLPFWYPLTQIAVWGLGPGCTLLGIGTLIVGFTRWRKINRGFRLVLLWIVCYGVVMGGLYVKFPRYFLPLYPWVVILAAKTLFSLITSRSNNFLNRMFACITLLPTIFMGIAQASVYSQTHPWITASQWMIENLEPGDTVAYEAWDHPLPILNSPNPYNMIQLQVYDVDSPVKIERLLEISRDADMLVIASRRAYGALVRNKQLYQETLSWYEGILEESNVRIFTRCAKVGPFALSDDPLVDSSLPAVLTLRKRCSAPYVLRLPQLDESFRVYDTPMVILINKR